MVTEVRLEVFWQFLLWLVWPLGCHQAETIPRKRHAEVYVFAGQLIALQEGLVDGVLSELAFVLQTFRYRLLTHCRFAPVGVLLCKTQHQLVGCCSPGLAWLWLADAAHFVGRLETLLAVALLA